MRFFHIHDEHFIELAQLPTDRPAEGFLWISYARKEFDQQYLELQLALQRWDCGQLVDLHIADLLNPQLASNFDYTSWYDLMIFQRLAAQPAGEEPAPDDVKANLAAAETALKNIDTSPLGFAVFDHVLITIHPDACSVREFFADKLGQLTEGRDLRGSSRLPSSPAELMLRMVNHLVDNFLELRRQLSRHLGNLQRALMDGHTHFDNWPLLLTSRDALHRLEEISEDQRSAVQEWIDSLDEWPASDNAKIQRERELLRVRSRDVLEHIERVLTHVRRLESSSEAAVQMHFSALGHRTNAIMRTLTVLTAIFLPLNLITGIFGMNFDGLPLIHKASGFWFAFGLMLLVGLGLGLIFWRKRYLSSRH